MACANYSSIPVIDLSKASSPATKPEFLDDLRHALTSVGFLYILNHGIPQPVVQNLVEALPRLFSLPAEYKEAVALRNSPHFLGYSGTGAEMTAGKVDKREQFEFATELIDDWTEVKPLAERLRGPNQVGLYCRPPYHSS
jgi:isopenicillin N synthase-like dioxygenase